MASVLEKGRESLYRQLTRRNRADQRSSKTQGISLFILVKIVVVSLTEKTLEHEKRNSLRKSKMRQLPKHRILLANIVKMGEPIRFGGLR